MAGVVRAWKAYNFPSWTAWPAKWAHGIGYGRRRVRPDVILTILGLDSFQQDVEYVNRLKAKNPESLQVIFGHYPLRSRRNFGQLRRRRHHQGEPDEVFGALLQTLVDKRPLAEVPGICYRENGTIVYHGQRPHQTNWIVSFAHAAGLRQEMAGYFPLVSKR